MTSEHYDGRIAGIKEAAEVMRANAGDEFDRAYYGRVVTAATVPTRAKRGNALLP
jgi:hypothetical protein